MKLPYFVACPDTAFILYHVSHTVFATMQDLIQDTETCGGGKTHANGECQSANQTVPKEPSPTSLRIVYDLLPIVGLRVGGGGPPSYTTSPSLMKEVEPDVDGGGGSCCC